MTFSVVINILFFILLLVFTGEASYDYGSHTGAAGVLENEYLPSNGGGYDSSEDGHSYDDNNNGHSYDDHNGHSYDDYPDHIVNKALECFNDKNVYSGCAETYRLSESGELHVPPEYTDQFCSGECSKETHLVLDCIESIMSHFRFYNKATIKDIRDTMKEGCSFGSKRGDFNVEEHIQYDESSAILGSNFTVHCLVFIFITTVAWFFLM